MGFTFLFDHFLSRSMTPNIPYLTETNSAKTVKKKTDFHLEHLKTKVQKDSKDYRVQLKIVSLNENPPST